MRDRPVGAAPPGSPGSGRSPIAVDAAVAAALLVLTGTTTGLAGIRLGGAPGLALAAQLLAVPAILWRRHHPLAVFAVTAGLAFGQWIVYLVGDTPFLWNQLGVLIALYTMAERGTRAWRRVALGTSVLGVVLALTLPGMGTTTTAVLGLAVVTGVYLVGVNVGLRRAHLDWLEERAERLAQERDQQARIAVADERARIARELHDVVAHNISVVVVQAEGALWALDGSPEDARTAVATIAETGRATLTEMRQLLGVLRNGDSAPLAPQPGGQSLTHLVDGVRSSGLPVELSGTDRLGAGVSQGLQLTIYRIVQESLTNVLKHAGPAASAQVQVTRSDDALIVEITDDGLGSGQRGHHVGHGLVGIRERAALFGGEVHAGPRPGGGFTVRARLPHRTLDLAPATATSRTAT